MRAHIICGAVLLCGLGVRPAMAQRVPFENAIEAAGISAVDASTIRGKIRNHEQQAH